MRRATELLKKTSRSFYLTLRVLPTRIRSQIGLAYLLARTTDTIADAEIVPVEKRLQALDALRQRILGKSNQPLQFSNLAEHQGSPGERRLLEHGEETLALLSGCSREDQRRIREVLEVITSGQELDLQRFACAGPERIVALQNDGDLDDYTWRVAGCVGGFWTQVCRAHLFPNAALDEAALLADGVRFGKGLQLVNILRDIPRDLRQGRCYLPQDRLAALGLEPGDLLEPASEPRLRPLYEAYLGQAHDHLAAGWRYTNALPRNQIRLRLACAWPVLIGAETIKRLRARPVLDPGQRIKISRRDLRRIIIGTLLRCRSRAAWERQFGAAL